MFKSVRLFTHIALLAVIYPATAAGDGTTESKFKFYGYLTQAYAMADGLQVLGITEDGTFDYRNAALQMRYAPNKTNTFVVQLSHSENGESPFEGEDLEIDWAFFRHSFRTGTDIELGRIPIEYGVFNRFRDAGISLPFYRPPVAVYFDGAYTAETVDGLSLSHRFAWANQSWSLDVTAYFGDWTRLEAIAPFVGDIYESEANEGFGTQFWVNTPIDGLRFGLASQHFSLTNRSEFQIDPEGDPINNYLFSVDLNMSRLVVRAEASYLDLRVPFLSQIDFWAYYVQLGYRFTDRIEVFLQLDESISKNDFLNLDPFWRDLGVSFGYHLTPSTLLRLELHSTEGYLYEENPADGILPGESDYGILSVSFSF